MSYFEEATELLKRAEGEAAELVAALEQSLAEARETQRRAARAVAALDPDSAPKPKKKAAPNYVSEAVIVNVRNGVRDVGGHFTSADLLRINGHTWPSNETLKRGLRALHEQGELRLVKQLRGGQKVYEVIR